MKVLFSNMPWWENYNPHNNIWEGGVRAGSRWPHVNLCASAPDFFVFGDYLPYPFFMGYATTYAQKNTSAHIIFRDSIALRESWQSYFAFLDDEAFDMIFIESSDPSWKHDKAMLAHLIHRYPHTEFVLCGPLCARGTALMDEIAVAAVIQGEYEKGSVRVINGERGVIPYDFLTSEEMNAAPFPYYDGIIAHRYLDSVPVGQTYPHIQVFASRGCPYHCSFCVFPNTMTGYRKTSGKEYHLVRKYTKEYMSAFLCEMKKLYDFKTVYFDDDTFNLGDTHTRAMCEVMQQIQLPFTAMCRADTISHETWKIMKDAGCLGVKLGFESGDQCMVENVFNKNLNLEQARQAVQAIKNTGMSVHGTFLEGYPEETPESRQTTLNYRNSLCLDTYQESCVRIASGTKIAEQAAVSCTNSVYNCQ